MKSINRKNAMAGLVVVFLILGWTSAWAETLYVERAVVQVKKGRAAFYPTVYTAKKGEALEVLSSRGGWYQVRTPKGPGWVFGRALTAEKPKGFNPLAKLIGTADTSELDKTAGFKGFDQATETEYASRHNLGPQMRLVDSLQQPAFTVSELESFQKKGRLGAFGGEE